MTHACSKLMKIVHYGPPYDLCRAGVQLPNGKCSSSARQATLHGCAKRGMWDPPLTGTLGTRPVSKGSGEGGEGEEDDVWWKWSPRDHNKDESCRSERDPVWEAEKTWVLVPFMICKHTWKRTVTYIKIYREKMVNIDKLLISSSSLLEQ